MQLNMMSIKWTSIIYNQINWIARVEWKYDREQRHRINQYDDSYEKIEKVNFKNWTGYPSTHLWLYVNYQTHFVCVFEYI